MPKNKKRQKNDLSLPYEAIKAYIDTGINTDPMGSYTGRPVDNKNNVNKPYETPVQDADDL